MFVLEEYLVVIVLAAVVSFAGSLILLLLLTRSEEAGFLDKALSPGTFARPAAWPRLARAMTTPDKWRGVHLSVLEHARLKSLRVHLGSWVTNRWETYAVPSQRTNREGDGKE
jgi:hypothetical protein